LNRTQRFIKSSVILTATVLIAAAAFWACYQYDNKYTADGSQPLAGVLILDDDALKRQSFVYLIRDWEIYRGRLLKPDDFQANAPAPDEIVFIGQYGGFEGHAGGNTFGGISRNPHGSASYRLNIFLPSDIRSYTLELPEIYSAYKLYINGTLMAEMGQTDAVNYRALTGNRFVTVQAAERLEILIAAADYSYIYSGMVYPPAFGESFSVIGLLNTRLALRAIAVTAALVIGILYLCLWLLTKKAKGLEYNDRKSQSFEYPSPLYYAALCTCFALYTCYPVVKTVFTVGIWWYYIENFAYCAMFLLVMLIQRPLTGVPIRIFKP